MVYYSWTGNTRKIAEALAERMGFALFALQDKRPRRNFPGSVIAALTGRSARVQSLPDINSVETVLIGTPVWAGRISSPVNTFLKRTDFSLKKVYGFCTMASATDPTQIQRKMQKRVEECAGKFLALHEYVTGGSRRIDQNEAKNAVLAWFPEESNRS